MLKAERNYFSEKFDVKMQVTEKQKQIFLCKIKYSNFLSNHFKQNDESLKVSLFY